MNSRSISRALCEPGCACDLCAEPFSAPIREQLVARAERRLKLDQARIAENAVKAARRELAIAAIIRALRSSALIGGLLADHVIATAPSHATLEDLLFRLPSPEAYALRVRELPVSLELAEPAIGRTDLFRAVAQAVVRAARARIAERFSEPCTGGATTM